MQKMRILIVITVLFICTIQDIKSKYIDIRTVWIGSFLYVIGAGINFWREINNNVIYCKNNLWYMFESYELYLFLISLLPGIALLFLAKYINGIGEGDGWIVLFIGAVHGIEVLFPTLIIAFLISSVLGGILLFIKKVSLNTELAFVPFITGGYLLCVLYR